ncbi:Ribonuclease/ribotoxin [Aspergillus piperis CBS 112811]|uniref:Ribonuclease/ribotoxin n=1 Tax=Aspergillus piperis CBS 112811 TaxID=1448313 RepID=A0A8G1RC21_9EURO|nr:Ribonuclease/ribotoxin [Aspergillus piperis CBS 112811]RAH63433.1 Ribonuclease/ribotoxin [Aspergillus piperis CBS 112811]
MLFSLKPTLFLALALTAVASPIANPTADEPSTLVARGRAKIKDVNCGGEILTKMDISNAIRQSKGNGGGIYPKPFMNYDNFFGASNMQEYPLIPGGTYTGNGAPGKYRVIMNGSNQYVGSVYHPTLTGNTFKKCSNIADSPTTTTTTTTTTRTTTTATAKATTNDSNNSSGNSSGNSGNSGSKSSKKSTKKPSTKTGSH